MMKTLILNASCLKKAASLECALIAAASWFTRKDVTFARVVVIPNVDERMSEAAGE